MQATVPFQCSNRYLTVDENIKFKCCREVVKGDKQGFANGNEFGRGDGEWLVF